MGLESCRESVADILFFKIFIKTPDPILSSSADATRACPSWVAIDRMDQPRILIGAITDRSSHVRC